MKTPFVFGRIATGENFTDREYETDRLVNNFNNLINTMIISPRRWGKSSLVHKATKVALERNPNLRICEVDLFNVRTEADFFSLLANSIIKATATKWDDIKNMASHFLKNILPKIVISSEPGFEFSLDLDWERVKNNVDEIIDLPEKIAQEKGINIVVCIDEFQNISYFSDALYLQKRLRAHWQRQQNVCYCLYGSKRHMLMEVFANASMPFYKFGDLMFLDKIDAGHLSRFIEQRFCDSGKHIDAEASQLIPQLIDCHPYYTQQLAQLSWLRTSQRCDTDIVVEAHKSLVAQLSLLFSTIVQTFTNQQIAYLHALCDDCKAVTSVESMRKYGISSSSAAQRSKRALVELDILDDTAGKVKLQDPVFEYWLRYTYFKDN